MKVLFMGKSIEEEDDYSVYTGETPKSSIYNNTN